MDILLTGSTGYIGQAVLARLLDLLRAGYPGDQGVTRVDVGSTK